MAEDDSGVAGAAPPVWPGLSPRIPAATAAPPQVAVVIPCYKVKRHILEVIEGVPAFVSRIYCVDDDCPEESGRFVVEKCSDPRVKVLFREENGGVGAAVCTGYRAALADDCDICVKLDGDGQMDPRQIVNLVTPIAMGQADYTKGNRFFNVEDVRGMPGARLFGNVGLSFLTKLSSGYWDIFDPTNGFTAVHARVLERLPLDKLHSRYFFESDLLFRLGCLNARVFDVPMTAIYADEESNLRISKVFFPFVAGNLRNLAKRILYIYFVRDFSIGSIYLIMFLLLAIVGLGAGIFFWAHGIAVGRAATPGQVMFAALPLVFSLQLALSFMSFDIARTPRSPIHIYLTKRV